MVQAFCSGVLLANAAPHAYAASVGASHLTPLRGKGSGPGVNALWSTMNVVAAIATSRSLDPRSPAQRRAFKVGIVTFSAWALLSEWVTELNE